MSAVIGALRAELSASIAEFQSDLGKAANSVKGFVRDAQRAAEGLERVGTRMSVAITAPLVLLGTGAVKAAKESREAFAQVETALDSMGGASGKSAAELKKTARQLQSLSTFDDDDILAKVTANLLRFGNISGDTFDRAQKAALNLSARLGLDLAGAASVVGKALDQPVAGLQALSRLGIRFTEDQKKQITALVVAGRGYEAQALILKELETRFDGAALAARNAAPGSELIDQWRDLNEAIGDIIIKAAGPLIDYLTKITEKFNALSPELQEQIVMWGAIAAVAGPVIVVMGQLVGIVGALAKPVAMLGALLADLFTGSAMTGIIASLSGLAGIFAVVAAAVVGVVALIWPFRDMIVKAFSDVYEFAKLAIGDSLTNLFATLAMAWEKLVAIFVGLWNGPLGAVLRGLGLALASLLSAFIYVFGGTVTILIATFVNVVSAAAVALINSLDAVVKFLSGDFVGAWEAAKAAVIDTGKALVGQNMPKTTKPAAAAPVVKAANNVAAAPVAARTPFKSNFDVGPSADKNREALDKLATAAKKDAIDVRKFASGGLDPLGKALEDVDTRFETLRNTIEGHIGDLKRLTLQNAQSKATMALLQQQLVLLDAAHQKARAAAEAQYEAEKELAGLQAQAANLDVRNKIRDFSIASGRTEGPVTEAQKALKAANDDLAHEQIDAAVKLKELQNDRLKAELEGNNDEVDRLDGIITLQQQYYDLVASTTGEQITAAERIQKAWDDVASGVSDSLLDVLTTFEFNTKGAISILQGVLKDLLKPVTDAAGGAISGLLKGAFSGFFADGGYIPPGQWGIAGENGAEPIFGGRTGKTVIPAQEGSAVGSIYIDARGAVETVPAQIEAAIRQAAPGIVATSVMQAGKNVPSQVAKANKRNF